jgi:hypothetical protein
LPELLLKSLIVGATVNSDRLTLLQLLVVSCTLRLRSDGDVQKERLTQLKDPTRCAGRNGRQDQGYQTIEDHDHDHFKNSVYSPPRNDLAI